MSKAKTAARAEEALTERGKQRYRKIIETATRFFLTKGYEATSVNEIIYLSGGSLTTVYRCFKNKEGLFWAVFESMVRDVRERYNAFQLSGDDYKESMKSFVAHIYANMFDPKMSRLMLVIIQIEPLRQKMVDIMYRRLFPSLRDIMAEIAKRYDLRYVFGLEETLRCVLRHARGCVIEFMFNPEKMDENKRMGIEQTTAVLILLTRVSAAKTHAV